MKKAIFVLALLMSSLSYSASAQVSTGCNGDDCGTVQVPANDESQGVVLPGNGDMPPASDAGSAPGQPINDE